jgi:membrane protease YdiL (CAAX protease family)
MHPDQEGVAGIIRRYPIAAFLVWFFTVGQAFAFAPLYLETAIPDQWFIIGSTLIGLLLPVLVITRIVDGPDGLRALGRGIVKVRASLSLYVVGVVVMPILAIGLAVAFLGAPEVSTSMILAALGTALLASLALTLLLNNLWEEVAWTGFVQARLQHRHTAMRAALITAPLFALQHLALIVANDASLVEMVILLIGFMLVMIPFRAFAGWLYNRSGGSLFLVGLVHALSNAVAPGSGLGDGYLRALYPADAELVGVLHLLALAVLGLVVMAATRLRLGLPSSRPAPVIDPPLVSTVSGS